MAQLPLLCSVLGSALSLLCPLNIEGLDPLSANIEGTEDTPASKSWHAWFCVCEGGDFQLFVSFAGS